MTNVRIEGKNGITCEIVQHSKSSVNGAEIVTFNLKYGLLVHSEHLRHRLKSFSVASNRAIPMKTIRRKVLSEPYVPVWFGKKQKGMVADQEVDHKGVVKFIWKASRYPMCGVHWILEKLGGHKEFCNRLLNPWQFVEMTVTATEWDNFYNLRLDKDAQKDIQAIAELMWMCQQESEPEVIHPGEYHVPYVKRQRDSNGVLRYYDNNGQELIAGEAVVCSTARCARSSYNNHDNSDATLANDIGLYERLFNSGIPHSSPAEHQGQPMGITKVTFGSPKVKAVMNTNGITHVDSDGNLWSGNLKGFIQHRQTLDNHVCWNYHSNGETNEHSKGETK